MAKPTVPAADEQISNQAALPVAPAAPPTTVTTNWLALQRAQLFPTEIVCSGYKPGPHLVDNGCHTRIPPDAQNLLDHVNHDHGGGFQLRLRLADTPWAGWQKFIDLGLESHDFRCEICDKQLPFHPQHILVHMKPHNGKSRRISPGGVLNLTIGRGLKATSLTEFEAFTNIN